MVSSAAFRLLKGSLIGMVDQAAWVHPSGREATIPTHKKLAFHNGVLLNISYFKLLPSDNPMRCKSWGRQREIDNMCSQKLCSKTSIRFCSPNIPGTRETQKRRPRPSSISIG
ncbi:hypothetical protein J6590_074380 [Homalodisca vitripennis]|nr:hypothetical protein J6590_074380 [Homalodisca vitripennis]